jgi:hypothetical protein
MAMSSKFINTVIEACIQRSILGLYMQSLVVMEFKFELVGVQDCRKLGSLIAVKTVIIKFLLASVVG